MRSFYCPLIAIEYKISSFLFFQFSSHLLWHNQDDDEIQFYIIMSDDKLFQWAQRRKNCRKFSCTIMLAHGSINLRINLCFVIFYYFPYTTHSYYCWIENFLLFIISSFNEKDNNNKKEKNSGKLKTNLLCGLMISTFFFIFNLHNKHFFAKKVFAFYDLFKQFFNYEDFQYKFEYMNLKEGWEWWRTQYFFIKRYININAADSVFAMKWDEKTFSFYQFFFTLLFTLCMQSKSYRSIIFVIFFTLFFSFK